MSPQLAVVTCVRTLPLVVESKLRECRFAQTVCQLLPSGGFRSVICPRNESHRTRFGSWSSERLHTKIKRTKEKQTQKQKHANRDAPVKTVRPLPSYLRWCAVADLSDCSTSKHVDSESSKRTVKPRTARPHGLKRRPDSVELVTWTSITLTELLNFGIRSSHDGTSRSNTTSVKFESSTAWR